MSGDTTQKFPPETFDAIIDQVSTFDERDNNLEKILGVFGLVSKSWLPRSRHHLFQTVTVDREERPMAKPFMDLLDSPICTFKPYVQILDLDEALDREPTWLGDALPRLSTLPAVRDLTIHGGIFTSPNSAKVLSKFHNLQSLMLDGCNFASPAQLLETLSICVSLKRIGLYGLWISHSDSPIRVNSPPPSSLRFVAIHGAVNINYMMEWLVSGEQVPAIETLDLSSIQNDDSRATGHGLQVLGPSLKNLEVRFTPNRSFQNAFLRDVDLKYNTSLNSLCLRSGPVSSILAQVTSPQLRQFVVDIALRTVERLEEVDWDAIARILDQPNFAKLEKLIIPCSRVRDVEEVRHWMMQRLPPGRARDKLILCEEWFGNRP